MMRTSRKTMGGKGPFGADSALPVAYENRKEREGC